MKTQASGKAGPAVRSNGIVDRQLARCKYTGLLWVRGIGCNCEQCRTRESAFYSSNRTSIQQPPSVSASRYESPDKCIGINNSKDLINRITKHVNATRQAEILVVFVPIGEMDSIQEQLRDADIPRDAVDVLVLEDSPK